MKNMADRIPSPIIQSHQSVHFERGILIHLWVPLVVFITALTVAEITVTVTDARFGIGIHFLTLFGLIWYGSFRPKLEQNLYWSLTIAPLIRIISLSMPVKGLPLIWWFAIISAPLFLAVIVTLKTIDLRPSDIGLSLRKCNLVNNIAVGLIGVPLGVIEYIILKPTPLTSELSLSAIILPILILIISTGFVEELIFRGLLQHVSIKALGNMAGPILVSIVFMLLHIGYHSWADLIFVFLVGSLFAFLSYRLGTIWGVSIAHGLLNSMLFVIVPVILTISSAVPVETTGPVDPPAGNPPAEQIASPVEPTAPEQLNSAVNQSDIPSDIEALGSDKSDVEALGSDKSLEQEPVPPTATTLTIGQAAIVSGTDSCLNIRAAPSVGATIHQCLRDGSHVNVSDEPVEAEGRRWFQVEAASWAAADYLKPLGEAVAPTQKAR